jgi:hypothetical protein
LRSYLEKNPSQKGLVEWVEGIGPECKPQNHKKEKKNLHKWNGRRIGRGIYSTYQNCLKR